MHAQSLRFAAVRQSWNVGPGGSVLAAETTTSLSSVVALVFAQAGVRFGASIEGVKYTRIMP